MREWLLENTEINETEYDNLINPYMIDMVDSEKNNNIYTPCKLFSNPLIAICRFTLKKQNLLRKIRYRVISEKNYYIHQKTKFYILSEIIKEMSPILYSTKRFRKCGELSLEVAARLKNDCHIVTAICYNPYIEEHPPFLHTFLITSTNEFKNEYCIDSTINAIIEKETYFNIFQTKVISSIPKKVLTKDMDFLYEANIPELNLAEYLCFPKEIIKTAKKLTKTNN